MAGNRCIFGRLSLVFVLLASLFLVQGCPGSGGNGKGNAGGDTIGTLTLPIDTDVPTLDPAHMVDVTSFAVGSQIFGRLVRFDSDVKLKSEMADSWTISSNGLTLTFHLRKGILFHPHPAFGGDERESTADDFLYSFTRLLDPETASERGSLLFVVEGAKEYFHTRSFPGISNYLLRGDFPEEDEPAVTLERLLENISYVVFGNEVDLSNLEAAIIHNISTNPGRVEDDVKLLLKELKEMTLPPAEVSGLSAPDRYTFEITLSEPYGPFLQQMAMINFAVVPREVIESLESPEDFGINPIGTGAFRLAEWQVDQFIRIEAFPQKHKPEPRLKSVTYEVIPDRQTQYEKYKSGELDICNVPTGQYMKIKNHPEQSKELRRVDNLAVQFYVLNLTKDPWRDELFQNKKALRQAVNFAIDREYISEVILEGRFRPFVGLIPPSMKEWTNPEVVLRPKYKYDPGKAAELLIEAGHPQGLFLDVIKLSSDPKGDYPAILVEMQGDLKNISIVSDIEILEWTTFIDAMQNNRLAFHRLGWVYDFPDPDNLFFTLLHSSQRGASGNFAWFRNKEFDKLVEEARISSNLHKRRELYWKAEQIVLEEAPWIFAFSQTTNVLVKPWVKGVKLSGMDTDASLPNADLSLVWIDTGAKEMPHSAKADEVIGDEGEDVAQVSGESEGDEST